MSGSRLCLYEDGTEVTEDYFPGIPNDAELLLLTADQSWQGCKCKDLWRWAGATLFWRPWGLKAAQSGQMKPSAVRAGQLGDFDWKVSVLAQEPSSIGCLLHYI